MTDDPFVTHRGLLFTVAYEMRGAAGRPEDMVQETWRVGPLDLPRSDPGPIWSGWSPGRR